MILEQPFVSIRIEKFMLDNVQNYGLPFRLPTTIGWSLGLFPEQPGKQLRLRYRQPFGANGER
jgi:hypothetical protein